MNKAATIVPPEFDVGYHEWLSPSPFVCCEKMQLAWLGNIIGKCYEETMI